MSLVYPRRFFIQSAELRALKMTWHDVWMCTGSETNDTFFFIANCNLGNWKYKQQYAVKMCPLVVKDFNRGLFEYIF